MIELNNNEELEKFINFNSAVLVYFSTPNCSVCKVLKPKLIELFEKDYPKIKIGFVNIEIMPDVAGQSSIFAVPTILVYFERKEIIRKSRNINLSEFHNEILRPYSLLFDH